MVLTDFRTAFPEFASVTDFPDASLTFWSGIAEKLIVAKRWADMYVQGVMLCTAHYLVIARDNMVDPGASNIIIASESAGDVAVTYDISDVIEPDAGEWNASNYGRQFLRLARMFGSGGFQL